MAHIPDGQRISRRAFGLVGALACAMMLAACSQGGQGPTGALQSGLDGQPGDKKATVKIALLVPLTAQGHPGLIGKSLKQAAELALFERDIPHVQLVVKDDKGTPEGAKAAAEEAIKSGATLILGPLFAKSVATVAPVAKQAGVPVVAFSNDRQVAGNGVYLLSFQPGPEVARVVSYAVAQGKRRFAALIPDDAFGKVVGPVFRDAVARAGGTVVALESYPPSANAMLEPLRKISAVVNTGEMEVDALFIPGAQENLELLGRLLAQAEIDTERIKLIGTGGMDYPNAGREARLIGAWYPGPDPRGFSDFSQKFAKTHGQAPPRIASLAYDGVTMAIALSGGAGYSATTLTRASGFTGVDGAFRLGTDGGTERALAILEVQKFAPAVVEAAPSLPSAAPAAVSGTGTSFFNFNFNQN